MFPNILMKIMKMKLWKQKKITDSNKGANSMEYNLGIAIRAKMKEMKQEGREEGTQKGLQEGILKVAKNLLNIGMDIDKISEVTDIPVDELQKLLS